LTSPLFFEMDALIKDLIDQGRSVFPDADFRDGLMFYDHAEWELALDAIFFSIEALHREVPIDLYEAILRANEKVGLFDASHYDSIKPKTR